VFSFTVYLLIFQSSFYISHLKMADKDYDSGEEEEKTIADDVVVTKYNMAAKVANDVLKLVVGECKEGASVRTVCEIGDNAILDGTSKIYKKDKELKKGIGFPTCISIDNVIGHYSPLASEGDTIMKEGDLVKIDLGVHVDGFIANIAHSFVIGASVEKKVTGPKADVLLAAYYASEAAYRLVKPGNSNNDVTDMVTKVAEQFKCKPVEGMLSHQLQQNIIDGEKTIIQNPSEGQKKDHKKVEFELHEVYGVDVYVSTGDGKSREKDVRTTVYKKSEQTYALKMKASRMFYSEASNKFGLMPFTLRAFDEKKARLGIGECVNHELMIPYQVLYEKDGEYVAQFKFTVLLMPTGPLRITSNTFDVNVAQSEHSIVDEEIKTLLATEVGKKSQKKKKKKATDKAKQQMAEQTGQEAEATPAPAQS